MRCVSRIVALTELTPFADESRSVEEGTFFLGSVGAHQLSQLAAANRGLAFSFGMAPKVRVTMLSPGLIDTEF